MLKFRRYKFPLFPTGFLLNLWFWSKFRLTKIDDRCVGDKFEFKNLSPTLSRLHQVSSIMSPTWCHRHWSQCENWDLTKVPLWESKSDLTLDASRSSSSCILLSNRDKRCSSFKSKASGPFLCRRFWSLRRVFKFSLGIFRFLGPIRDSDRNINLRPHLRSSNCFCNSNILECRSFCARLLCSR